MAVVVDDPIRSSTWSPAKATQVLRPIDPASTAAAPGSGRPDRGLCQGGDGFGGQVTIVSSDKDLMQLIRPGVEMLDPIKQKPIGPAEVMEKFGVTPDKMIDLQALIGERPTMCRAFQASDQKVRRS